MIKLVILLFALSGFAVAQDLPTFKQLNSLVNPQKLSTLKKGNRATNPKSLNREKGANFKNASERRAKTLFEETSWKLNH